MTKSDLSSSGTDKPSSEASGEKQQSAPHLSASVAAWSKSHDDLPVYEGWSSLTGDVNALTAFLLASLEKNAEFRRESLPAPPDEFGTESKFHDGSLQYMSVAEALDAICDAYGDRKWIGERMFDSSGRRLLRYKWTTYSEMSRRYKSFAAGLHQFVAPRSTVALCCENSTNWVVADMALQSLNTISVMMHQAASETDIEWVVSNAKLDAVITAPHCLKTFARVSRSYPQLSLIVVAKVQGSSSSSKNKGDLESLISEAKAMAPETTKIFTFEEIEAMGADLPKVNYPNKNDDELFTISYTSGSTGRPKGLMLSVRVHRVQMLESRPYVAAMSISAPLSHASRRTVYHLGSGGGRVTLFNAEMSTYLEELQMTGPVDFIAVPRFWNILHGEYHSFTQLYTVCAPHKVGTNKIEKTAQDLFLDLLGGKANQLVSAGAPPTPAVYDWMHVFRGMKLITQCYGAMEIGGAVMASGKVDDDCEFKIEDVPDMGYSSNDKPFPRGEFLAKSPIMFLGYHNNEEETRNARDKDGFFRTGDIVQVEGPDMIRVIDRKKFIFKLAQGEYVSPAKSEGIYTESKFISQILCHGSSVQSYLVALIVPDFEHLTTWAKTIGIDVYQEEEDEQTSKNSEHATSSAISFSQLCALPQIKSLIMSEMRLCEKNAQMRPFERALDVFILSETWTPENGLLTATSKLNRTAIVAKYRQELESLGSNSTGTSSSAAGSESENASDSSSSKKSSEALDKIKELLSKVLSEKGQDVYVTNDLNLVSTGLDSMSAIKLVNSLNRQLNISVPVSSLYQPGLTIESLAQAVEANSAKQSDAEKDSPPAVQLDINPEYDASPFYWLPDLLPSIAECTAKRGEIIREEVLKKGALAGSSQGGGLPKVMELGSKDGETPSFDSKDVKHILLTGSTGFLGLNMIKPLLDSYPDSTVYCLIRAKSDAEAIERLDKALEFADVGEEDEEMRKLKKTSGVSGSDDSATQTMGSKYARIRVVRGDLANSNNLGIDDATWQELCDNIDAIFHVGAWVNLIFPYHLLRSSNVGSTALLLRMAMTGKKPRKQFHYVSTLSALTPEETCIGHANELFGFEGYVLSKRVCEVMLSRLEKIVKNLPIVIHRVGAIFGHSKTGHINIEALIHKIFTGMIQFGYYPIANEGSRKQRVFSMNWAPVDYYAKTIVHIASNGGGIMKGPKRYNISNPARSAGFPMSNFARYAESYGYSLKPKHLSQWSAELKQLFREAPGTNWLEPLKEMVEDPYYTDPPPENFDLSATVDSLSNGGTREPAAECGVLTESHIHAIFDFCIKKGLLQPPKS